MQSLVIRDSSGVISFADPQTRPGRYGNGDIVRKITQVPDHVTTKEFMERVKLTLIRSEAPLIISWYRMGPGRVVDAY